MTMRLRHILLSLLAMQAVVPATAGIISSTDPVITVAVPNITRPFGAEPTDLSSGSDKKQSRYVIQKILEI